MGHARGRRKVGGGAGSGAGLPREDRCRGSPAHSEVPPGSAGQCCGGTGNRRVLVWFPPQPPGRAVPRAGRVPGCPGAWVTWRPLDCVPALGAASPRPGRFPDLGLQPVCVAPWSQASGPAALNLSDRVQLEGAAARCSPGPEWGGASAEGRFLGGARQPGMLGGGPAASRSTEPAAGARASAGRGGSEAGRGGAGGGGGAGGRVRAPLLTSPPLRRRDRDTVLRSSGHPCCWSWALRPLGRCEWPACCCPAPGYHHRAQPPRLCRHHPAGMVEFAGLQDKVVLSLRWWTDVGTGLGGQEAGVIPCAPGHAHHLAGSPCLQGVRLPEVGQSRAISRNPPGSLRSAPGDCYPWSIPGHHPPAEGEV